MTLVMGKRSEAAFVLIADTMYILCYSIYPLKDNGVNNSVNIPQKVIIILFLYQRYTDITAYTCNKSQIYCTFTQTSME